MKTQDWQKITEIVVNALELDVGKRGKFVEKTCADSPEIRLEVESLLDTELEAENFFESPAVFHYAEFFKEDKESTALIGQQIGRYRLIREIGWGGMGAVYLAARIDGEIEQEVAVKLLKREFNVGKLRRNFEREKEILAKLSHPNIAALIDSGTTDDGIPFLVMEYIEGENIDVFCRRHSLSLNQRLKLFNRVCDAVAFAHRNLIVHRDLKPSNILITKDGVPKLLDFGISKLLDSPHDDKHTVTNLGTMTPQYASPEQIKGESVTTATDIYSLGVILFELLTESFPYSFKHLSSLDFFREIVEKEPISPSRRALVQEIKDSASSSYISLPFSSSRLKGDLDNIILKSLCKEPERRYKTVEQFSADIWRFIDGMPVLARPNTFFYRASKFYRRNQFSVLAGFLIVTSLFAGIAIALSQANAARIQARIAYDAQRQTEAETAKAKTEEEKAEKISNFMAKIISYANPAWYAEGSKFKGNARVIDALDDLSEKIDTEFAGQADIQSELHHKFAEVYNFVGQSEKDPARAKKFRETQKFHALQALKFRKQFYGEWHELVAKDIFYAYSFIESDKQKQAELLAKAIIMMRETNPQNLNLPYMLEAYTSYLMLPSFRESHEIYRRAAIPPTDETNYQIAERYLRESLVMFRFHYKEDNLAIFVNECKLAYVLEAQEKWTDYDLHHQICRQGEEKYPDLRKNLFGTN